MRRSALRWLGGLLGAAVFGFVVWRLSSYWHDLHLAWDQVSWPMLAASFGLFGCAQMLFAFSWHRLLADHGATSGLRGDVSRWWATLAGKYLPGKVWQGLARIGVYHRSEHSAVVAPAFLREMLLTISAAVSVVAFDAWLEGSARSMLAWPMSLLAILLLLLAAPPLGRAAARLLKGRTRFAIPEQSGSYRGLAAVWLMQLAAYVLLGLGFVALAHGLLALPASLAMPGIAGLCFAGVAGIAAFFVPAGIGVREAALAWYLSAYIGPGPAALLAVASRVWLTFGEACLIAAGLLLMRGEDTR